MCRFVLFLADKKNKLSGESLGFIFCINTFRPKRVNDHAR